MITPLSIVVSVVIPVYNVSCYLEKCLDSVLGQSYGDIEVIAVNDGSTDDSAQILDRYAVLDSRLTVIHQQNKGSQGARKAGIDRATGLFVCFVDSDDSLPACSVIGQMVGALTEKTQILAGRIQIDNGKRQTLFPSAVFTTLPTAEYVRDYLLCGRAGWNLCGKLFRTSLVKRITGLPIKVTSGEDALYTISLASSTDGEVTMVNTPVYNYFVHAGSITHSRQMSYIVDNFKVADYIDGLLGEKVEKRYLTAFRLLCLSGSFRYGWLGSRHTLYADTLKQYREAKGILPLFGWKKRVRVWLLIHFGDVLSKYVFKNFMNERD